VTITVAEDLEVRRANVEARLGGAVEQAGAHEIHHEPDGGDPEHGAAEDHGRLQEPAIGLEQDPGGDREQRDGVDQRGEDLGAVVPVGLGRGRRAAGDPDGEQRESEPARVGEHVTRVGQEREAARPQGTGHLDDQESARQRQGCDQSAARACGSRLAMGMRLHRADRSRFLARI
jgi:hypothetical protein